MIQRLAIACLAVLCCSLAAAQEQEPLLTRLDDASRARVLAALAGLIILGFAMVLFTWLGARVTQRYRRGQSFFRPTERPASAPREKPDPPDA